MEEIKQIGLNIWGLRGGHKCFCHSDNLDINAPEISRTWLDIRDILYVSNLTLRFYAMEFTSQYKVFTLYRPENDTGGRSGAYVATTLYVPHSLKVNRTLDLLRQISDAYHNDHYDAFGNPNTNPDYVQVYLDLIKNYAGNVTKEHDVRSWEPSAQNGIPRILPFTKISVVEEFFDKPYRKEFLNHQEVMFWDIIDISNPQSRGVTFLKREIVTESSLFKTDGEGIAPQFEGGAIKNTPNGFTIERFVREGVDITSNWESRFFYDKTNIDIVLRKPYHEPFTYRDSMNGTGSPFVKHGRDDYDFSSRIDFQPKQYKVPVMVDNVGSASFTLYFGNQRVDISNGRGTFTFDGTQANGACKVSIRPDGMTDFKVGDITMNKFFSSGGDETDRLQPCVIDSLKNFRFMFNQNCSGKLKLKYTTNCYITFSTFNKAFEIVLPAEKKAVDFQFEIDDYNAEIKTADNTTFEVTLTKKNFFVEVDVHPAIRPFVSPDFIHVKVGGQTHKGYRATVPFAEKNSNIAVEIDVDGKGHVLNCDYDKSYNGDDVTLHPRLALLHNGLNQTLKLNSGNGIFEIPSNSTVAIPDNNGANRFDNDDRYKIETEVESSGIRRTTISPKSVPVSETMSTGVGTNTSNSGNSNASSGYQGGYQGGYQPNPSGYQPQTGGVKKTNKEIVGKYTYEGEEYTLDTESRNYKNLGDGCYSITIDGMQCVLCFDNKRPLPNKQKEYDKFNKKNGFTVEYQNGKYNVKLISRKRKGGKGGNTGGNGGNGNNGKRRWLLWGGIGLGVLLLIGGIVWLVVKLKEPERFLKIEAVKNYTYTKVEFVPEKSGYKKDNPGSSSLYHLDRRCTQVIVHVKGQVELSDTIDINQDMFTEENHYTYVVKEKDIKDKVNNMVREIEKEEQLSEQNEKNDILGDFEYYLRKVWSMDCSLVMLDLLENSNNAINEYLGLSNSLKNLDCQKNPNYDTKKEIVIKVFNKDHTRGDGDDWVEVFIKKQRCFFKNLKELDNASLFSRSKSNWYGVNDRQFFTKDQQDVIGAINTNKPFANAHELIKIDSLANYTQIKESLENK